MIPGYRNKSQEQARQQESREDLLGRKGEVQSAFVALRESTWVQNHQIVMEVDGFLPKLVRQVQPVEQVVNVAPAPVVEQPTEQTPEELSQAAMEAKARQEIENIMNARPEDYELTA